MSLTLGQILQFDRAVASRWSEKTKTPSCTWSWFWSPVQFREVYLIPHSSKALFCSWASQKHVVIQVCPCLFLTYWTPGLGKEGISCCAASTPFWHSLLTDNPSSDCCISSSNYIYCVGNIFISSENPLLLNVLMLKLFYLLYPEAKERYFLMSLRSSCLKREVGVFCSVF